MSDNEKSLAKRVEEYNEFYEYYSKDKNYPLLSIKPNEKVLVLISAPNRAYAFSRGNTLIVGTEDNERGIETPVCAARVIEVTEGMVLYDDALNYFSDYDYSRTVFDKHFSDEEKRKTKFYGKLLEGVILEDALDRWNSIKDTVTQEELNQYALYLLGKFPIIGRSLK